VRSEPRSTPILGENGAGKSTLIKIMAGVIAPSEGRMTVRRSRSLDSPSPARRQRRRRGICVFQELSLIPDLSVADNICDQQSAAALRA
jgi:ribose transport system ATP-binding protein